MSDWARVADLDHENRQLRAENERLRAALKEITDLQDRSFVSGEGLFMRAIGIARKAGSPFPSPQERGQS